MQADTYGLRRSRRIMLSNQAEEIRAEDMEMDDITLTPLGPVKKIFKKDSRTWLYKSSKRRKKDCDTPSIKVCRKRSLNYGEVENITTVPKRSITFDDKRNLIAAGGSLNQNMRDRNIFKRLNSRSFSAILDGNTGSSASQSLTGCDSSPAIVDSGFGSFTDDDPGAVTLLSQQECHLRQDKFNKERSTFHFQSEVDRLAFPEDTTRLGPSVASHCLTTCSPDAGESNSEVPGDSNLTAWRSVHSSGLSSTTQINTWVLVSRSDISIPDIGSNIN